MPLSDYEPETAEIEYRGKVLCTVRGLNSEDVAVIVRNHVGDLRQLFSLWDSSRKLLPGDAEDIEALVYAAITKAPATIVKVIAIASDEPANLEGARRLSMPLQMKILMKVVELTFEDIGGPLEVMALIKALTMTNSPPSVMVRSPERTTIQ